MDIGALDAARRLQKRLDAPLIAASVTRLLVDLNRSVGRRGVFSALTRVLPPAERSQILAHYYHPYRRLVRDWIASCLARGERVVHLSVHSFTPLLDGQRRTATVGLLYDPARNAELALCRAWQAGLAACPTGWVVRRNHPYRGTADGQVVELRRRFPASRYLGIELELNQASLHSPVSASALVADLAGTLPAAAATLL